MAVDTLKTTERTLRVLRSFSRARPELTVAELTSILELPRSVVTRIVATLEQAQFLERSIGSFKYRIGIAACELGATYLAGNRLTDFSHEILRDLAERTGHTVYMGVLQGQDVVIVSTFEGRAPVRFIWAVGDRLPISTTAFGKAILLQTPPEQIDLLLGNSTLPGLAPNSINTRSLLNKQLEEYRVKGWIPALEESLPGVYAVGAALLDAAGKPLAGISVSFLRDTTDSNQIEKLGDAVLDAAQAINRRIAPHYAYQVQRKVQSLSPSYAFG
jgi:DNA-binding IclR family transcriptional regulator